MPLPIVRSTLPASFAAAGFVTPEQARHTPGRKNRRLMIRTEGESDTGKTEFMLTAPGPGMIIACDRGFDALCDNPEPPSTRRTDFGLNVVKVPSATQFANAADYRPYWLELLKVKLSALANPDAITVCVDGDNVSWDLQRLAEHGKLTGIYPQTKFTDVYAARRALTFRMWDSGKIIICSNMTRDEFVDIIDATTGLQVMDNMGQPKRERTGKQVSQGFPDYKYLWQIAIRHLYQPEQMKLKRTIPARFGLRIIKCKANMKLVGAELWGEDATFTGLVSLVYPHIPLSEWGL